MKSINEKYILQISGLALGKHLFSFEINDAFFEAFPNEVVQHANITISLNLDRSETMMVLNFSFQGYLMLPCDRCLEMVEYPISKNDKIVVRFSNFEEQTDDNLWFLSENEHRLDFSTYFYETILLMRPIQVLHPDDESGHPTCNTQMIKYLEQLETEQQEQQGENETDPRWEVLKTLKSKE